MADYGIAIIATAAILDNGNSMLQQSCCSAIISSGDATGQM